VRAPRSLGSAALRVHVYYRNHLLQSYRLDAEVTSREEQRTNSSVLGVSLEHARVERLVALQKTEPRSLSIAMNLDRAGTHSVGFKGTDGAGELTLSAVTYQADVKAFLTELEAASRDPKNKKKGRLYPQQAPGDPAL